MWRRFFSSSSSSSHLKTLGWKSSPQTLARNPNRALSPLPIHPQSRIFGTKVAGYREICFTTQLANVASVLQERSSIAEGPLDPFSLVADELAIVADRMRSMVLAEVPKLASAAEYFFRKGVEGKRFRPTILLLMASALHKPIPGLDAGGVCSISSKKLRARQQRIAEVAEMIHVASLLHDDVLDDADTRRGIESLNYIMGNKLAVLSGDFLLSRACAALVSLKNLEVIALIVTVIENLVTGETMQMGIGTEERSSMDYYLKKTYYKTASLISNSCKCVALIEGQTAEVSKLAYDYGRNVGLAFQLIDDVLDFTGTSESLGKGSLTDIRHDYPTFLPDMQSKLETKGHQTISSQQLSKYGIVTAPILFAMEEFPQLRDVVNEGFGNPKNVDIALDYLGKSRGIERARELAEEHVNLAIETINLLPEIDDKDVHISRRALEELAQMVLTRSK